ncbi:uncharacterized protein LOC131055909 [Cryptomeria japonica]|uniref:uncharacterized protein LOC131055909 n=1 Tax=Cryptomeria japonica TaxID=3369 RepID=UPI0027D9D129|nr:uncharacterized protein LOC131055909 [Cryptomeria japonica]
MSQRQLFTIDLLGIGRDNNGSPQLDSAMDCHQQLVHSRSTQSCLGKIRPHLLQQVLSQGCLSDSENFHREDHIGVSEGIKTWDLFPLHPLGFQSNINRTKANRLCWIQKLKFLKLLQLIQQFCTIIQGKVFQIQKNPHKGESKGTLLKHQMPIFQWRRGYHFNDFCRNGRTDSANSFRTRRHQCNCLVGKG